MPLVPLVGTALVAALGFAVDAFTFLSNVLAPVTSWLAKNREVVYFLVGAYAALKGALMLHAALSSFGVALNLLTTKTIPGVIAKFGVLKGLVSTPIFMPAIAVAAALAALGLVIDKHRETKKVIEETNKAWEASQKGISDTNNAMKKAVESGKISKDKYQGYVNAMSKHARDEFNRLDKLYSGVMGNIRLKLDLMAGNASAKNYATQTGRNATGTNHWRGGETIVGEHGPERVFLPQGAQVVPSYRTRQQSPAPSSSPTVIIQNYNSYNERDDSRFFRDLGFALETAS